VQLHEVPHSQGPHGHAGPQGQPEAVLDLGTFTFGLVMFGLLFRGGTSPPRVQTRITGHRRLAPYCAGCVPVVVGPRTHLKLSRSTLESQLGSPVSQMMNCRVMTSPGFAGALVVSHPVEPPPVLGFWQ